MMDPTNAPPAGSGAVASVPNERITEFLTGLMGQSETIRLSITEIADQIDRLADITERHAVEAFDHLDTVSTMAGLEHLLAGSRPLDEKEELLAAHLQAMMADLVRADYLRQALQAMAEVLRACVKEADGISSTALGQEQPSSAAPLDESVERLRTLHDHVGIEALRQRMLGRLGALGADER